jgi:hypothetical protein
MTIDWDISDSWVLKLITAQRNIEHGSPLTLMAVSSDLFTRSMTVSSRISARNSR